MDAIQPVESETVACPLCGASPGKPFLKGSELRYGMDGEFFIVRCVNCGHRYLNPRPTLEGMRRYYPTEYAPHRLSTATDSKNEAGANPSALKQRLRSLPGLRRFVHWLTDSQAEHIPQLPASCKHGLEIGCADGRFLQRLVDTGWEVSGVEFSEAAAEAARRRGLDVHTGTLESVEFPESTFDVVFAWMVIEHLHDPLATFGKLHRLLKPSGWLVFSVPNAGCWEPRVFGRYWHAYDLPRHLQHFDVPSLKRLLTETGFDGVRIIHQRNVYNLTGSLGLLVRHKLSRKLGESLLRFTDDPTISGILMLAPLAKLLAWIRQGGMLTVIARLRPTQSATDIQ